MITFYKMVPKHLEAKSLRPNADLEGLTVDADWRKVLSLPYTTTCPKCKVSYYPTTTGQEHTTHWPLVETAALDSKHPLLTKIRRVTKKLSDERFAVVSKIMDRAHAGEYLPADDPWVLLEPNAGRMVPSEFDALAQEVRETLQLSEERVIRPGQRLGLLPVEVHTIDLPDFCTFKPTSLYSMIVKERVVTILEKSGCTGWKKYPVVVTKIKPRKKIAPPMQEIVITGWAALKQEVLAEYGYKCVKCIECGMEMCRIEREIEKLKFEDFKWDGSDVFYAESISELCVTEKVKATLEANNITGIKFRQLSF